MSRRIVTADTLNGVVDFDHPFEIQPGNVYTDDVAGVPSTDDYFVDCDAEGYVLPGAEEALRLQMLGDGWETVGQSGQQGGGWVMHASEYIGGGLADLVLSQPGVYVVIEVRGLLDEVDAETGSALADEPIGWALLRRTAVAA